MKKIGLFLCAVLFACAGSVSAQNGPVRLIVSFDAGGPTDIIARVLAPQLSKELGRSVIVENKPGANGAIGAQEVLRARPDGSTLWLSTVGAVAINPSLYPKLSYDVHDFASVSLVVNNVEVFVVNKNNPANSIQDFIAATKARKEPTPVASTGIGSIPHLALEQFRDSTHANILHVPYKGAAPAITDVIGGHVDGLFGDVTGVLSYINNGTLKALGLAAPKRHPALPNVKTLAEQGVPGVDSNNWYGLFVSAKTPPAVIASINAAVGRALKDPDFRKKVQDLGSEPAPSTPQGLDTLLKSDTEKWAKLIQTHHIQVQ